jgi:hypothetical protein
MIKLLNSFNNFSFRIIKLLVPSFSGMLRVKAGRPLVNHLLRGVLLVKGSITNSWVKVIITYVRYLYYLNKHSGPSYVAKYLKGCVSLLMQALAGAQHSSTQVLGVAVSRTNRGLPRIIPKLHRSKIREGNLLYIRLWLTLFSVYRVIDYTGRLKISTIITPSTASINTNELERAALSLKQQFKSNIAVDVSKDALRSFWIASSSPNTINVPVADKNISSYSTSIYAVIGSLRAYSFNKIWNTAFELIVRFKYIGGNKAMNPIVRILQFCQSAVTHFPSEVLYRIRDDFDFDQNAQSDEVSLRSLYLGKLSFKVEPAGKIRVFAMVDCFTQWLLSPLHKAIFSFLRKIPEDATHNQDLTLSTFVERLRNNKIKEVYSFDLTAATDRIPVSAQAIILDIFAERKVGAVWSKFLTSRWYQLSTPVWDPKAITCSALGIDPEAEKDNPFLLLKLSKAGNDGQQLPYVHAVKYAAGQPMGALSSWAMLALTHHIMVRIAALRVGYREFSFYLVLGDDLVIADKRVAAAYLALAKEWDIGINLSKSILSDNGSLEFAKRFVYKYEDVSGLSFREMSVAKYDIRGLLQLFNRIKGFRDIRISELLSFLGHGYKALSRINTRYTKLGRSMAKALLLLSYPKMIFSKLITYKEWITSSAFNKAGNLNIIPEQLDYLKDLGRKTANSVKQSYLPRNPSEFKSFFFSMLSSHSRFDPSFSDKFQTDPYFVKAWEELGEPLQALMMPMYEEIHNSWDQTVVTVKDTYDFNESLDLDTLWTCLVDLEDISSESHNASEFRPINDIITLGSSLLLKRANIIRSHFRTLAQEHKGKVNQPSPRYPQKAVESDLMKRIMMKFNKLKLSKEQAK